jgi:hypothetical protein
MLALGQFRRSCHPFRHFPETDNGREIVLATSMGTGTFLPQRHGKNTGIYNSMPPLSIPRIFQWPANRRPRELLARHRASTCLHASSSVTNLFEASNV